MHIASIQELPQSARVNVSALSRIFDKATNSYKYLFFLSLLDILEKKQFDISSSITFQEIIIEMLANAWYPHNYFKLSFGRQDKIANHLDSLNLETNKNPNKHQLRESIRSRKLDKSIISISRYVPFRLIRPFFAQQTEGLLDAKANQTLIELANPEVEVTKPIYRFNGESQRDSTAIVLHQDWVQYISENYPIVRGWVSWKWLEYMQERNPNTPNVAKKIFMLPKKGDLSKHRKHWKKILANTEEDQDIKCIYSKIQLDKQKIVLDHYLPWSFVAHDQLWNLIPTFAKVNSTKSNNLPSNEYFDDFLELQYIGLKISKELLSGSKLDKYIEGYINGLKLNSIEDLGDIQKLRNAYEATIKPLLSLATIQGFRPDWLYKPVGKDIT
ncbi:HNH endonuclease domain-containing protein [Coleofasciculus sp. FACHB-64]|uniref:HNH endonuclease domain-containing protein n=1 Tax=Cyanophyceae TaxID=3028117 RepID=UPI0018F01165|nr:HNH endonuclease domain-containing protein [Coleofasciculus sp. FACHB-64]